MKTFWKSALIALTGFLFWNVEARSAVTAPESIGGMTFAFNAYLGLGGSSARGYVLGTDGSAYRLYDYHLSRGFAFNSDTLINTPFVPGTYTYQPHVDNTAQLIVDEITYDLVFVTPTAGYILQGGPALSFTLEPLSGSGRLANILSRALVSPTTPCIAGFIVSGTMPRLYLIRAVGPTLAQFGVPAAVPNPLLQLYKGANVLAENDDWETPTTRVESINQAVAKTNTFPLSNGSKDAAMVVLLYPGIYSAIARSSQGGELIVEIYLIP